MDHICLSPRLQMVADFVPPCACAADIGTDHGYLPIWLLQNGVIRSAIAADIHAGPLANARQSAAAYDLEERFRFVLADGLRFPDAQAADVVTIAGMGGETICAILAAAPWAAAGKTARFAAAEQSAGADGLALAQRFHDRGRSPVPRRREALSRPTCAWADGGAAIYGGAAAASVP